MAKAKRTATVPDAVSAVEDFSKTNLLLIKKLASSGLANSAPASVYAGGWLAKLKQAAHALQWLETLIQNPVPESTATTTGILSYSDQIAFYTDCFWAFSYATFDIGAQLINQVLALGVDERAVNLNQGFTNGITDLGIQTAARSIVASDTYRFANNYRNSSLHRRDICISWIEQRNTVTQSYAMVTTGPASITRIAEHLCDDPFVVAATFNDRRAVVPFSSYCLVEIAGDLQTLANKIKKAIP